ncbi:MAG: XrtN system VIT domain-containing protein [Bacteroidetes bacterium]|nr:XrtN system VIT domain-containing protein [Bacteroidota bacterium]
MEIENTNSGRKDHDQSKRFLTGYVLLIVSSIIYVITEKVGTENLHSSFSMFVAHYIIALGYLLYLYFHNEFGIIKSFRKKTIDKTIILTNLFLISAYSLNRDIAVFEDSVEWFCVYLIISSIVLLSFRFFSDVPTWVKRLLAFFLGCAIVLYLYMTLYVVMFMPAGAIGMIALGIGGHIFVPLILLVCCVRIIQFRINRAEIAWLVVGSVSVILVCVAFVTEWKKRITAIEKFANQSVLNPNTELPIWIRVGQTIPNDWITQRILKSDLVYSTRRDRWDSWDFMPRTVTWDEARKHDPLVLLASFSSSISLNRVERVNILRVLSDSRHRSNERLWTGKDLSIPYIVSDIDVYPYLRLAYTEKYFNIRNSGPARWNGNTQEAIFTFQLPEGSVVTSLSLWIEGKEEKAILTSKQKATKTYQQIVGVERRDPSVVHWQEGNTVTVRVFPCTINEERKFKIGITSPLIIESGKTIYQNITFQGPTASNAQEVIRFRMIGGEENAVIPGGFEKDNEGFYRREGAYDSEFNLITSTQPIPTNNQFIFQNNLFKIEEYTPTYRPQIIKKLYLDLNNSWTKDELRVLLEFAKQREVFVYRHDSFIQLTQENQSVAYELMKRNYSLFPFHLIKDLEQSLVVTKGQTVSPHLSDFKESEFAKATEKYFSDNRKCLVYNVGVETSAYVRSLRELRAFEFLHGSIGELNTLLKENKFVATQEDNSQTIIHDARIVIRKQPLIDTTNRSNAPDHLARLFAYNNVLRKVGRNYFNDDFINQELVDEASTAYVVSPVSSLIVLETAKDYERFDIKDNDNSLKNASKQSDGAVPEPHEWALIIIALLVVLYFKFYHTRSS